MWLKFQRSGSGLEHVPGNFGEIVHKIDEDLKRKTSRMNLRQSLNLFDNNGRMMYLRPTSPPPIFLYEMRVLIMR